jgi:hypothetical protein
MWRRKSIDIKIQLFLCFAMVLVFNESASQEKTILRAPDNWRSEVIQLPLSFAPQIDVEGIEDIRFAPGWSNPQSEQFWSYHFTWYLEDKIDLTEGFLEAAMSQYFDGLMKLVLKEQADQSLENAFQQTMCVFIKTHDGFKGKLKLFDAFFTQEYTLLNVIVFEEFCEDSGKQLVSFNLSPKRFDDPLWNIFNDVEIIEECK